MGGNSGDGANQNPGGGGGGGSSDSEFQKAIGKIDFSSNWKQRRTTSLDEWPMEKRSQIPTGDALYTSDGWLQSESVKSSTWEPPKGWEETVASEVDTLKVLNYGDMQFDPATAAVDAMFEEKTGISVERIQIVVDQAIPKMAATLSSKQGDPHLLQATTDTSMTTYAQNGWLEPADFLLPEEEMYEPYLPLMKQTFTWDGTNWGAPANVEGNPVHVRVDMLEEQGIDSSVIDGIKNGNWSWDDLETVMQAFEGTGIHAWGFRGSSLTYTERDFRIHWYQTGGQYIQDDESIKVNGPGALAALEKLIEWLDNGWLPDASTTWTQGDLADGFLSGNLAMVPVATDLFADAGEKYELDSQYVLAPPPKANVGPSPTQATWAGGPVLATNAFAPTPEKVAGALLQDARFSHENGWWEYVVESNLSWPKKPYDEAAEVDAVPFSRVRGKTMEVAKNETFPQQRAVMQKVSEELGLAYSGEKSAQEALDAAQTFIDTVLGQ
ncbi:MULTISPECIES: ABC transporter substrate-binding protein [unclassified Haladaptatus]|uniref:ABC transporter substrate-binding protein n=1 Tax=unclassified Haladaptatus TaxID=2622732 RepID=UPI0023E7DEA2|nr:MULTISPECIES: extracellular solute-binding protein [unclassified Haladaptatus]